MEGNCRSDDIFANSSTETVKELSTDGYGETEYENNDICPMNLGRDSMEENLNSKRMGDDSFVARQVIEGYCKPSQKVYCPFCPMSYTSDHLLKCHLKELHRPHMNLIFNDESHPVMLQSCVLCHATFYAKGLLPLHLLKVHENALVGLMNCRNIKNDGFLYCMYCRFTVVKSNVKTLMLHLEKMHFPDVEKFVNINCTFKVDAKEALSSLQEKQKFVHYSTSLRRPRRRALLSSTGISSSARRRLDFNAVEEKHVRKMLYIKDYFPLQKTHLKDSFQRKFRKKFSPLHTNGCVTFKTVQL
ncbi:uncharacterized protein [Hetaerina americana]|uniref:uncharacterized protein n=1 Tax=Hetaerina americana TaxID=62018 RepID=UPI003A7F52B1